MLQGASRLYRRWALCRPLGRGALPTRQPLLSLPARGVLRRWCRPHRAAFRPDDTGGSRGTVARQPVPTRPGLAHGRGATSRPQVIAGVYVSPPGVRCGETPGSAVPPGVCCLWPAHRLSSLRGSIKARVFVEIISSIMLTKRCINSRRGCGDKFSMLLNRNDTWISPYMWPVRLEIVSGSWLPAIERFFRGLFQCVCGVPCS